MTNIKDFLTGDELLPEAKQEFMDRMKRIDDEFVAVFPQLREILTTIHEGRGVPLETRTLQLSLPPTFWRALQSFIEVFESRREFGIHDPNDPADVTQDNIAKVFKDCADADTTQTVVSQMIMDAMMSFTSTVAKSRFLEGLERAIETGDPEKLKNFLKSNSHSGVTIEDLTESDDEDDDSED